ncbi:MAG: hypothetical protein D6762_00610 [Candidatus Neomarinimicrobiota bacterium]|nr:MAG: hypothetical protein D6762_00610 [Candidatus Neomarinimicrobiota bacterium]
MKKLTSFAALLSGLLFLTGLWGQGRPYEGPDDPAGDIAAEREGYMTGNRVFLYFRNTTELSDWPREDVSRWPNTYEGTKMLDGVALLVGAKVYIKGDGDATTVDTIPTTDLLDIYTDPNTHTLYYLQTSYREEMDRDPTGTVEWGFYPVFGYFNENGEYPAMSNKPDSWPVGGWPAAGFTKKWPGEWDGRFGRGVRYADLETYFVVNDAQDQEYLGPEDFVRYYPRPGRYIGDLKPDVTIQRGKPWGGLGIRVETRGFQWNNPQARDAIFWEYTIANVSDYDIRDAAFGYWVDNAIGGDGANDELGFFDTQIDLAYSWDVNGLGAAGLTPGTMGFAYLESPGLPYDGIDNDEDGITDEKRDNVAQTLVGPTDGYSDLQQFLDVYKLTEEDLHEHWDADEDQDWEDGEDINGDGIYQISEYAGDDVGLDGVAPGDINYTGPDEGEGNHKPDFVEGVGSEPNFAWTDVSESDMVGLTSFRLFAVPSHSSDQHWFRGDESMWELIGIDSLEDYSGSITNLIEVFASGPFPLYQGQTERISMSELHSYDQLPGLNSEDHTAPALFELKRIVQVIYEKDYRFAQPPRMPTLTATEGDGEVILTWDDIADTKTRDPFVGNVNDFEGYKVYRSTDKKMSDPEIITDLYGTPTYKLPIYQCDLKDDIFGFTDFGLVNGVGYNLGTETGITHHFIDRSVQNGRTYYYAVVAYDYGAPDIGPGIAPSENNVVIELDENENVIGYGKNVAIVVPHPPAAGYIPPEIVPEDNPDLIGSGTYTAEILARGSLKPNHRYRLTFGLDTVATLSNYAHGLSYTNDSFTVFDEMDSSVVYHEDRDRYVGENIVYDDTLDYYALNRNGVATDVFDGIRLELDLPVETPIFDYAHSGWVVGSGDIHVTPTVRESNLLPWRYAIIFSSDPAAYTGQITNRSNVRDENDHRLSYTELLPGASVDFYVQNQSFVDSSGNYELMDIMVHDVNRNGVYDRFIDRVLVGPLTTNGRWGGTAFIIDFTNIDTLNYPRPGDQYQVDFKRPFWVTDTLRFTVHATDSVDESSLNDEMDRIKVVPNPYIATNAMEPALANASLNQRRRLIFTHIPAQCTIKIFTVSGVLVDEIQVDNPPDNGLVHWDLLTRENLEIAAGMYLYHVKSWRTGKEKLGKFAVIK